MNIITETTQKQTIKQSNFLVQAKYSLSAIATDLLYLMLSEILKEHKILPAFKLRYVDIKAKMGKHIKWTKLTEAAEELTKCEIEIDLPDSKFLSHWCSYCKYSKTGERILELNIDPKLQEFLIDFADNAQFTISHFNTVASLRSTYTKRIYTMLMQFANAKTNSKYFVINVKKLKELLEVKEKYAKYSDFKKRVIDIAIKQINENENINLSVNLEEIKKGRAIDRVVFHIKTEEKTQNKKSKYESKNNKSSAAVDSLQEWLEKSEEPIIDAEVVNPAVAAPIPGAIDARTLMGM